MMRTVAVILTLVVPYVSAAQVRKIPVSVSRTGRDRVGSLFAAALTQELSRSMQYTPIHAEGIKSGLKFYVELNTVDVADTETEQGKRSVVSIVIQDMGSPNSYPVPNMWYHKIVVVDRSAVGEIAKELLQDMDARWCQHNKSSVGGCPKEKLYPQL